MSPQRGQQRPHNTSERAADQAQSKRRRDSCDGIDKVPSILECETGPAQASVSRAKLEAHRESVRGHLRPYRDHLLHGLEFRSGMKTSPPQSPVKNAMVRFGYQSRVLNLWRTIRPDVEGQDSSDNHRLMDYVTAARHQERCPSCWRGPAEWATPELAGRRSSSAAHSVLPQEAMRALRRALWNLELVLRGAEIAEETSENDNCSISRCRNTARRALLECRQSSAADLPYDRAMVDAIQYGQDSFSNRDPAPKSRYGKYVFGAQCAPCETVQGPHSLILRAEEFVDDADAPTSNDAHMRIGRCIARMSAASGGPSANMNDTLDPEYTMPEAETEAVRNVAADLSLDVLAHYILDLVTDALALASTTYEGLRRLLGNETALESALDFLMAAGLEITQRTDLKNMPSYVEIGALREQLSAQDAARHPSPQSDEPDTVEMDFDLLFT